MSELFNKLRADALAHPQPCAWCKASTGQPCVNTITGKPINAPAHSCRIVTAAIAKVTKK